MVASYQADRHQNLQISLPWLDANKQEGHQVLFHMLFDTEITKENKKNFNQNFIYFYLFLSSTFQ